LPQNYLPYRPAAIEPTVLSENTGPLRYIHRVVSNIHPEDPLRLISTPGGFLSNREKSDLAPYLELLPAGSYREIFSAYLEGALEKWRDNRKSFLGENVPVYNETMETIAALLTSFSEYQYNASDNDDSSIAALEEFLLTTKDGDCVEFSNTLALLGRLADIPSRVVTGFLAAESLQTPAHLRGLAALRNQIPALQEFPFEDLFLVTDAHAHSWTQFYLPDYGWLDFEATAFALPPLGSGDGNMRDVVIPLLDENRVFAPVRSFPWRAVIRAAGLLLLLALLAAYGIRYGREAVFYFGTRRGGRQGARSLYLLLLSRLAAEGKPIKPASKTAAEYAQLFPGGGATETSPFAAFAACYTELRWREFPNNAEADECFLRLKTEYRNILKASRRRGVPAFFIRIFSLRGLAYL
jgi:transglutaminase-like putative cysteine protease